MGEKHHYLHLDDRGMKALLAALDMARDQTRNGSWRWWHETQYVDKLYNSLRRMDSGG